jgi:hypothetical protein
MTADTPLERGATHANEVERIAGPGQLAHAAGQLAAGAMRRHELLKVEEQVTPPR